MREIKFRSWDKFTKKMIFEGFNVIGEVTCFNGVDHYGDENPNPKYESSLMRLNDFILLQYTGLKDKNGEEIYEGDIVELAGMDNDVIEWNIDSAGFERKNSGQSLDYFIEQTVVIGNIYENPGLI